MRTVHGTMYGYLNHTSQPLVEKYQLQEIHLKYMIVKGGGKGLCKPGPLERSYSFSARHSQRHTEKFWAEGVNRIKYLSHSDFKTYSGCLTMSLRKLPMISIFLLIYFPKFYLALSLLTCCPKMSHSLMEHCTTHKSVTLCLSAWVLGTVQSLKKLKVNWGDQWVLLPRKGMMFYLC